MDITLSMKSQTRRVLTPLLLFGALCAAASPQATPSPMPAATTSLPGAKGAEGNQSTKPAATDPAAGQQGAQGGDSKSASGSATKGEQSASGKHVTLGPLDPADPPARAFPRKRIGLALGGGGALGLSEIGTLQWLEEHHIPVDVIAGTSIGCMVSALYSTGRTPEQLKSIMNDKVFGAVFSFSNSYSSKSFRRREDARDLPNAATVGLRHGVSFRNSVLTDQGLNAFLDRQFLRYDDQTDFNQLPIPLRCLSTDLNDASTATFARGSIPDAVRASVSLPGVFQPFALNGHEYVDGGVLENLPTATVHTMDADVVLAVSLPLEPVSQGQLGSLLGLLGRSFSVAIEGAERQQRKLADVVITPDLKGFNATDYLKAEDLSKRGYAAAEANAAALLPYALSDADWSAYLTHRNNLRRGPAGPILRVRVTAPTQSATLAIQRLFAPLVNQPTDTRKIEALLDQIRADGRYEADYTVGYETAQMFAAQAAGAASPGQGAVAAPVATTVAQAGAPTATEAIRDPNAGKPGAAIANPLAGAPNGKQEGKREPTVANANIAASLAADPNAPGPSRTKAVTDASLQDIESRPILLVTVAEKKTGPPFLLLGANLQAQAAGITNATVEATLLNQDFGSYGTELRSHFILGYLTNLNTEYFRPLSPFSTPNRTLFLAPRAGLLRQPFPIFTNQTRIAERQLQRFDIGADVGVTNSRNAELRAGFDYAHISWLPQTGSDAQPSYIGTTQRARVQYTLDTQDRAIIPTFGIHLVTEAAFLFDTVGTQNTPQLSAQFSYAHRMGKPLPIGAPKDPKRGRNVFVFNTEGATEFRRNVAQPFRYTLGGPLRLSASSFDQYRGTDYAYIAPALLHRIAQLPQPLGQDIYLGAAFEAGAIGAPGQFTLVRSDVFAGLVAETPLGAITAGPAIGTNGERKFVFTLGRLF